MYKVIPRNMQKNRILCIKDFFQIFVLPYTHLPSIVQVYHAPSSLQLDKHTHTQVPSKRSFNAKIGLCHQGRGGGRFAVEEKKKKGGLED